VAEHRHSLLAQAYGDVLEVGFGTGLNLPHYPPEVRKITTVDPSTGMHRLAQKRIEQTGRNVDQRLLSGERLPFDEDTFDCVVSTFTLCSINNVHQALSEIHRVLKPGGRYLLLEHGLSPEPGIQKWQRRLNRFEMWLGDGCRLDRDINALVRAEPFASVELDAFYLDRLPKTHGYMYQGTATK
jgi:ubiquinone/menaquinone biosynthesis C-methylase UbiE